MEEGLLMQMSPHPLRFSQVHPQGMEPLLGEASLTYLVPPGYSWEQVVLGPHRGPRAGS